MKRLPFRQGGALVLALAVLAAVAMALWLGVFSQKWASANPGVNLVITKTAVPTEATGVVTGGTITYTLIASNTGDAASPAGVVIRDTLGTGLTFVSMTPVSAAVTCADTTGPDYDCTADTAIGVGESRTVTVVATVAAASGYVYNGAYVDPANVVNTEDNEDADDPEFDCTAVGEGSDAGAVTEPDNFDCTRHGVAMPDLTITKTASSPAEGTTVPAGSTITYNVTVINLATATGTATNVLIRDTIGSNLTYYSATPGSGVICGDLTPPVIECTAASIAPGETRAVTIAATVAASTGALLNGAYVDPANTITEINEDDDDTLNCAAVGEGTGHLPSVEPDNFDCTSHTAGAVDLTITKTASPIESTTVTTGSTITYALVATNSASATVTATNVAIRDILGTGLTYVSAAGTGVTCTHTSTQQIDCTVASLAPGASATVTVVATVSATSGSVLNGAEVDPADAITESNEDADDPDYDCSAVGEGTTNTTEPDNFDCTRHTLTTGTPTPTPTPTTTAGVLLNCPLSGKWAMSVWNGPSGKATGDALTTCPGITIVAAYSLDRTTNTWLKYFPGRGTDVNDLLSLSSMQAIFTLAQ